MPYLSVAHVSEIVENSRKLASFTFNLLLSIPYLPMGRMAAGDQSMSRMTARRVETEKRAGMHNDGEGLYLHVSKTGAKSWILRTMIHSKRSDIGLGSASLVTLAEARDEAHKLRKIARSGGDPLASRRKEVLTFEQAARRVYESLRPTWRNTKHAETWLSTVANHAYPVFGGRPIDKVGTSDILEVLSPIWTVRHETAKRLKQRLSTIFDWAKGSGHYPYENPVNGLIKALPPVKRRSEHRAAKSWPDLPVFLADLRNREGMPARTLEFIILTAARSGEARGARWSEIEHNVWSVPAERMKRGVLHRVPLSDEALKVLDKVRGLDRDLVFPSSHRGPGGKAKIQSVMVFKALLLRMQRKGFTVHGFRPTFRDWCSDSAHADRELAEAALSHASGNEVERAYARADHFERRRTLMANWALHATEICRKRAGQESE